MSVNSNVNPATAENLSNNEVVYSANSFYNARSLFRNYINYTKPLTFEEWMSLDSDKKTAALFVQFFEQISLAWYKLKTNAAIEEECVSEVIMYLMKNTPIIEQNPSRYKPSYIYQICYNCIYCKSIDPYKGQTAATSWYNNTTSQYVKSGDDTIDIFDTVKSNDDVDSTLARQQIWKIIEDMGEDAVKLAVQIINGNKVPARMSKNRAEILESLKVALVSYKEAIYSE